jgi:hypothetical protein
MPLTINVGLNRKSSRDFQSRGTSINITAELDPALLASPQKLQEQIAALYTHAEEALEHQQHKIASSPSSSTTSQSPSSGENTPDSAPKPATRNQMRALRAIAERLGLDLDHVSRCEFEKASSDLDIREASRLIDLLKSRERQINDEIADRNGVPVEARRG